MRKRLLTGVLTTAAIVAMQDTAIAGSIYRWADSSGQAHYSDRPPSGAYTVVRETAGRNTPSPVREQGPGLRHGEIRLLEQRAQQRDRMRRERLRQHSAASTRRTGQQQYCRSLREGMRNTRDHSRRKHHAGELRRHCW